MAKKFLILEENNIFEKDLDEISKKILEKIENKKLIMLEGEVGSGKTTLTKSIGILLDLDYEIKSPTYGYKSEYNKLIHYDLYQLNKKREIKNIYHMIMEDLSKDKLIIIEWPKNLKINKGLIVKLEINRNNSRNIKVFK